MQRTSKIALNSGFIPAEACALQDDVILLCLASSTRPRRRNLLAALAQCTVSHFRSSSWFLWPGSDAELFMSRTKFELRTVPTNGKYFFPDNDYVRKVDHIRGYWNPKRKLGVTAHFSEITALQYGEKRWRRSYYPQISECTVLTGTNSMISVTRLQNKQQMMT